MTKLLKCACRSEYQDQKYGLGVRVMNMLQKAGKTLNSCRCTVCGVVHS
jgi:hypothetical protein